MTSTVTQVFKDFEVGRVEGEEPVRQLLYSKFGIVCDNVGKQRLGWDLQVASYDKNVLKMKTDLEAEKALKSFKKKFGTTIEVKRDKTSDRTGNVYWEVWSNKRVTNAGCMLECKADTIVFVRKQEFIFLHRAKLLSWLFESFFLRNEDSDKCRAKTMRGSSNKMIAARNNKDVQGILIPVDLLKKSVSCFYVEAR